MILAFPDRASALSWAGSAEYQEIAKHRLAASDGAIVITEGFSLPLVGKHDLPLDPDRFEEVAVGLTTRTAPA